MSNTQDTAAGKPALVYSVLLSLHDRDSIDLQKTFQQLAKASFGRDDIEFVLCMDFAEGELPQVQQLAEIFRDSMVGTAPVKLIRYDTMGERPDTFNLQGHNNPVAVNNALMDAARGINLVWISSDVIVSPLLFKRLDMHLEDDVLQAVYCGRVLDQDTGTEFCGPSRPFPMMWCVAHPHTGERHDLELLKGFGYDDNDWMARMGIKYGSIVIDIIHICIHQTHGRVSEMGQLASGKAYSVEAQPGWDHSYEYMLKKWGGIPFDGKTLDVEFGSVGDFMILNIAKKA